MSGVCWNDTRRASAPESRSGASPLGVPGRAGYPQVRQIPSLVPRFRHILKLVIWCRPSQNSHWLPHTPQSQLLAPALKFLWQRPWPRCIEVGSHFAIGEAQTNTENATNFGVSIVYLLLECSTPFFPGPARISTFVNAATIRISLSDFIHAYQTALGFGLPVLDCRMQLHTNLHLPSSPPPPRLPVRAERR